MKPTARQAVMASLLALSNSAGCQPSVSSEAKTTLSPPVSANPPAQSGPAAATQKSGPVDTKATPSPDDVEPEISQRSGISSDADNGQVRARRSVRSKGKLDITFDDLEFSIERDGDFDRSMLTDDIEELNGRNVVIRGFILASSVLQQTGITKFVLVRDNQECCFGPGAYLYHNVRVEMEQGKSTSFAVRPVTVEGTISIEPWIGVDGKCYSVYYMKAERVR